MLACPCTRWVLLGLQSDHVTVVVQDGDIVVSVGGSVPCTTSLPISRS